MKSKMVRLALQLIVLAGFLLTQGCATGECPIDWLNWPYGSSTQEPLILPVDDYTIEPIDSTEAILLPPDIYTTESYVAPVVADAQVYVVQKGDTLASVAAIYGISWKELAAYNNISNPDILIVGYELRIPGGESLSFAPSSMDVSGQEYVVKKGDTLSGIASMYDTSWKRLAEYNHLSNPNRLVVGQKIRIPGTLTGSLVPVTRADSPVPMSSTISITTQRAPIEQGSSYVVQRGDSLSKIASRAGLTVDEIKAVNALTSNRIVAGKSLRIPKKGEVSVTVLSEPAPEPVMIKVETAAPELAPIAELAPLAPAASAPVYEHVLYPGETIEDVARQYGSSQEEIMLLNGITDPAVVKPGTKLLVPIPE